MSKVLSAISVQCTAAAVVEYVYCPVAQRQVPRRISQASTAATSKACFYIGTN